MSRALILMIGLLVTSLGFAQGIDDLVAQNQKLMQQNSQFSTDIQAAGKAVASAQVSVAAAQKAYDNAEKQYNAAKDAWSDTAGGALGFMQGSGDPQLKKAMDDAHHNMVNAHTNLATAQQTLNKNQQSADDLQEQQGKVLKDLQTTNANYDEKTKAIASVIQSTTLISKFSQLQQKVGSAQTTLNRLSSVYDQSVLGAYMKDKMTNLLNSGAMCQAQKACAAGKTPSVSDADIQKAFVGRAHASASSTTTISPSKSTSGTK